MKGGIEKGKGLFYGGTYHKEKGHFNMRMPGHLLQRKLGTLRRRRGTCENKRAPINGEKGNGHFYILIGAFVKAKGALSYVNRGNSDKF